MITRILFAVILLLPGLVFAQSEADLLSAAKKGDYQAQRNIAYSYANGWGTPSTAGYIEKNPIKSCAWYRVVLMSKSNKVDGGDFGNEWVYCSRLDMAGSEKAWIFARSLLAH